MKKVKYYLGGFLVALIGISMIPGFVSADEKEEYSAIYQKITSDGTYHVNAIDSDDSSALEIIINNALKETIKDPKYSAYADTCNYDSSLGEHGGCAGVEQNEDGSYDVPIGISWKTGEKDEWGYDAYDFESHILKVYLDAKIDENIKKKVDEVASKIADKDFVTDDLGYINFIYNIKEGYSELDYVDYSILYSNDLIKSIGNKNVTVKVDTRMGGCEPYNFYSAGFASIYYDGVGYAYADKVGTYLKNVLYIPSTTEDNVDSFIDAAMKRIKEYLGENVDITIKPYKKISEILDNEDFEWNLDDFASYISSDTLEDNYNGMNNKLDMIYEVSTHGNKYYIIIEKNDDKMIKPLFGVTDETTNVSISTTSGNVPLDANLKVSAIALNSDEYKAIEKSIEGDFSAIDLKLYSKVKDDYISTIDNGKFSVSVPLDEKLVGKEVSTYYIKDDGTIEEYTTIVKDNLVTFETDHFSTYIVAEKQKAKTNNNKQEVKTIEDVKNNPPTGDNKTLLVIILIVGVAGVIFGSLFLGKNKVK